MSIDIHFQFERESFKLDVDISLPSKGVTAVFGPSGCGKTTLLRLIAGLENAPNGFIKVGDQLWQKTDFFLPVHKRSLAFVFQEASLFEHLTVYDNIKYGFNRIEKAERRISLQQVIELLAIKDLLARKPAKLSGGERQRVAIARALAVSPAILLMDEPLASLDAIRKQEIFPYLVSLHKDLGIPILYVTHSLSEVARIADHLLLMNNGQVLAMGCVDEMLTRFDLPLAHDRDAVTVIKARVIEYDMAYRLAYLDSTFGCFSVISQPLAVGSDVRLQIGAKDISITLDAQRNTSILNIFPVVVDALEEESDAQLMVRCLAGGVPILARITRKSADLLKLKPGMNVYAQAKSVALLA